MVTRWAGPLPSHGPELVFGRGVLCRCQVAQRRQRNNTPHSTGRQRVGALQLSKERAAIHSAVHNAEPDTAKPNRSKPALSNGANKAHLKRRCSEEGDLRTCDLEVSRVAQRTCQLHNRVSRNSNSYCHM